jgi:hypothetical protein
MLIEERVGLEVSSLALCARDGTLHEYVSFRVYTVATDEWTTEQRLSGSNQ